VLIGIDRDALGGARMAARPGVMQCGGTGRRA
jgi:hypothetical protein